ncbi:hypothetical protein PVL29_014641 [Vitis rotundifolia]|uniref:Uncharacterized protein n=1 Tax=Vitis rotundifolia TaxID=103349 RepID=A0AA39DMM9_VITRO|nr:hypothetical protein PVL29_014641 [Vitis rotundifolia]
MIVSIIGNKAKSQPVEENEKASGTQTHKRQSKFKPRGQSPELSVTDILTSFNYTESVETTPPLSFSICKAVLTTGLASLSSTAMQNPPISKDSYTDVKDLAHSALDPALAKANQALVHIRELFKNTTDLMLYKFYGTCIDENQGVVTRHLPRTISAS